MKKKNRARRLTVALEAQRRNYSLVTDEIKKQENVIDRLKSEYGIEVAERTCPEYVAAKDLLKLLYEKQAVLLKVMNATCRNMLHNS